MIVVTQEDHPVGNTTHLFNRLNTITIKQMDIISDVCFRQTNLLELISRMKSKKTIAETCHFY